MINFIKKAVIRWVREDWNQENQKIQNERSAARCISISESNSVEADPILTFRVYSAHGGQILESSSYDKVKDRYNKQVYVLHKDDSIEKKMAQIVSMEFLRS